MRLSPPPAWVILFAAVGSLHSAACHKAPSRAAKAPSEVVFDMGADATVRDTAWHTRAAVVSVDPGNSITNRRSESTFSTRTSRARVDSHTSSLLVQVAALNHSIAQKQPLVEQQLRDMGLQVVGQRRSKLRQPNDYNVLVEDVTYVEESERRNARDPLAYTLVPAVHVRVISANERTTLQGAPIAVKLRGGNLTPSAADTYGRQLATARAELGRQLVRWLESRLQLPAPSDPKPASHVARGKRKQQAVAQNAPAKK